MGYDYRVYFVSVLQTFPFHLTKLGIFPFQFQFQLINITLAPVIRRSHAYSLGLRALPPVYWFVMLGRLKIREWKMRYGQKCKGGKCRSRLAAWKAEPILYSDMTLNYFLKIFFRLVSE